MPAQTTERLTDYFGALPARRNVTVRAAVRIFKGALVALDSAGNAMPAGLLAGGSVRCWGVSHATTDNRLGVAGEREALISPGIFRFNNQAGDLVTKADVLATCFVSDDNTVARTSAGGTRIVAGVVQMLEPDGTVRVMIA